MSQMSQMSQMGADPTRMGPPKAASGPAGGQRGRRGRAFWGARAPAPPLKPMLEAAALRMTIDPRFSICVNRWNLWTQALFRIICGQALEWLCVADDREGLFFSFRAFVSSW